VIDDLPVVSFNKTRPFDPNDLAAPNPGMADKHGPGEEDLGVCVNSLVKFKGTAVAIIIQCLEVRL